MQQYPLKTEAVISQSDLAAGRTNLVLNYKDYAQRMNAAFYDGFMAAVLETKEEADTLDVPTRAILCAAAMNKSTLLCGTGGDNSNMDFILSLLFEEDLTND